MQNLTFSKATVRGSFFLNWLIIKGRAPIRFNYFSTATVEGQHELGEHCKRLPGVQRDRGGHEPRRFPQG